MSKDQKLRIIPIGGLGEVGKNMMAYEYGNRILVVDAGLMFPDNDMLGVDYIIPDFQYLRDNATRVEGIIITHGHEDHIGAIQHLLAAAAVPVYATPLTRGLIEVKLARNGLSNIELHTIQAGEVVQIGPFQIETFHVCHSIPDAVGLGITTPAGLVVVLGCAHRGVINTLNHARKLTGVTEIHAVLGGAHLANSSAEQVWLTIAALKELGVARLGLCHCTGLPATAILASEFGAGFFYCNSGTTITLP